MSKAVLISINPKWCDLIARGEKTVEVRKTRPKLETPFKCYIYRTKGTMRHLIGGRWVDMPVGGTVIGEFVCDNIQEIGFSPYNHGEYICKDQTYIEQSCIPFDEMFGYLGEEYGYGWHISNLVIYDKLKELSEFRSLCKEYDKDDPRCGRCEYYYYESNESVGFYDECLCDGMKHITRPPQSWCYVEELEGAD